MRSSRIASKWFIGLFAAVLSLLSMSGASAQTLWYNGDDNGVDSYFSTASTGFSGIVYDDFTVTSSGGWQVNGVFGNFLDLGTVSNANWFIRSGVSAGNGGTVVASGTSAATVSSSVDAFSNTSVSYTHLGSTTLKLKRSLGSWPVWR